MKKLLVFIVAASLSTGLFAVISLSAHDFSGAGWTPDSRICVACHTPHNAIALPNAPIWNHTLTVAVFTMYGTTYAGNNTDAAPTDQSKLCLSCHDGVTAMDAFGGAVGATIMAAGITANVTTVLSDDHPISIDYVEANDLNPVTNPSGVTGGTNIQADMLYAGKVECSSCHDVHNKFGIAKLLKRTNTSSGLCLTCHAK